MGGDKYISYPAFPIGYIYISAVDINPAQYFGGVWERYAKGCVLAGINESDTDSNSKTNFNKPAGTKIGSKYLQAHNHAWDGINPGASASSAPGNYPFAIHQDRNVNWNGSKSSMHNAGSGDSQNIQPTVLVYMYRRVK